jgi:hypothetical protein
MDVKKGFKRKTIEKTIQHKISEWLKTIENEELQDKIKSNYIVTGGAIASMLQGNLPNDYDVYLQDPEVAAEVARYYVGKLPQSTNEKVSSTTVKVENGRVKIYVKSSGIAGIDCNQDDYDYFESAPGAEAYLEQFAAEGKNNYVPVVVTTNAISLTDDIQIVLRFTGDPSEIHKNFDFVHCTNWFTEQDGLVLNQPALESIMAMELKYVGSLYPVCSLFRIRKFIKRGWTITAGEVFKIAYDCSKLDLNDKDVLREQLTGVDAAYFNEVLRALEQHDKPIDRTYLFELINRIFDEDL